MGVIVYIKPMCTVRIRIPIMCKFAFKIRVSPNLDFHFLSTYASTQKGACVCFYGLEHEAPFL